MEVEYCVICQDSHKMNKFCLQDVQCKNCSMKSHLKINCPQLSAINEELANKSTSLVIPNLVGRGIKRKNEMVTTSKVVNKEARINSCKGIDSIKCEHF